MSNLAEYKVTFDTSESATVKIRIDVSAENRASADFPAKAAAALFSFGEVAALDFTRLASCGFFTASFFDVRTSRRAVIELTKLHDMFVSAFPDTSESGVCRSVVVEGMDGVSLDFIASSLGKSWEIEKFTFQGDKVVVEFFDIRAPINSVRIFNPRAQQKEAEPPKAKRQTQPIGNSNSSGDAFYQVNSDMIRAQLDLRTTCMVRNIPNKYTQKMLLKMVDAQFANSYDFFYLPVDFKNKCNVGYAFVNFLDPQTIPSFMSAFDSKRWDRFNSDKVCRVTYARLQGKDMLMDHFKSSSIMQQHKNLRPFFKVTDTAAFVAPPGFAEPSPDAVLMDALENWSDTSSCLRMFDSPDFLNWDDGASAKSWNSLAPENKPGNLSILGPPPGLKNLVT